MTAQEHRSHKAEQELEASLQALREQANQTPPTATPPPVAPQPNAALETARAQVAAAEADPNAARYAPLDLEAAKKDLTLADSAAEHHQDAEVSQPAYMAAQTARLAQARASAKANDAKVAQGQQERDRIRLAAQQREVSVAVQQRNEASQEAAILQAELQKLKATQTNRGIVLTLGDVLFDTGRSELNPGAATKMDQLAGFLKQHPDRRVEVVIGGDDNAPIVPRG